MTLLYNLIMTTVDLAVLLALWKRRDAFAWCVAVACAGAAAVVLAGFFGLGSFGIFRLAAYGIFLHGTLVLAGSAVLLWSRRRAAAIGSAVLALLLAAVAIDAFLIEPTWLEVSHLRIDSPKVTRAVRIVVLADLQTDQFGQYEREVFRRVLREKPDLILLAGDYLQAEQTRREELCRQMNAFLHQIEFAASAAAFAVGGNVDTGDWPKLFHGLPVTIIHCTDTFEVAGIRLTCLVLPDSMNRSLRIEPPDGDRFHLVLGHCPDFALGEVEADLLVAGHTHGGQVRLPWIGPLITLSGVPRSWAAGQTDLPGGGKLLVSRGVGMERGSAPRLRFLCRPELLVIDLVPAGQ